MNNSNRTVLLLILSLCHFDQATAQTLSKDRLKDWEFRFYACKHVLINTAYVLRVMKERNIGGEDGITRLQDNLGPALSSAIPGNEPRYRFSVDEAVFVSDLTFAVVSGINVGGQELSDIGLISSASDLCVQTIEGLSQ